VPEGVDDEPEAVWEHLRQLDHWTFLLALGLVILNIAVESWRVSALAAALLLVALVYDAAEFLVE